MGGHAAGRSPDGAERNPGTPGARPAARLSPHYAALHAGYAAAPRALVPCMPPSPTHIDTPPHRPTLDAFRGELRVGAESSPFRENPSNLIRVMPAKGQGRFPRTRSRPISATQQADGLLRRRLDLSAEARSA